MRTQLAEQGIRKARRAGLHYVRNLDEGWRRRRCGRGFTYLSSSGKRLTGKRTLQRIARLAIPPAWEDVRICPSPTGHLQAIGRDAKGRQQYLYHADWHAISAATKFDRLERIGALLPKIRRRVRRDLGRKGLQKERIVAAVVRLIDKAHLRVGSPIYAQDNGSYGATTLTAEQVQIEDITISLDFPGKSGKQTEVLLSDAKVASVIQQCEEIRGQFLFCYRDDAGDYRPVSSSDVNAYLLAVANEPLSAKDFRTWWACVMALKHLQVQLDKADGKATRRAITRAIEQTAEAMGHTKAVCQQSYIHPGLLAAAEKGNLQTLLREYDVSECSPPAELTRDEAQFLAILPAVTNF
jgi:DNA topoisomerase-1